METQNKDFCTVLQMDLIRIYFLSVVQATGWLAQVQFHRGSLGAKQTQGVTTPSISVFMHVMASGHR